MSESSLELRKCKSCGAEKALEKFPSKRVKNDNVYFEWQCKQCAVLQRKKMRQNDIEKTRAEARTYWAKNKETINKKRRADRVVNGDRLRKQKREWHHKNAERISVIARVSSMRWRRMNKEKIRLTTRYQRAKRNGVRAEKITNDQIQNLYTKQRGSCAICRTKLIKWHMDHIMPLAKGGAHEINNLQLLCPRCNVRKHSTHPIDYMQKLGFLL